MTVKYHYILVCRFSHTALFYKSQRRDIEQAMRTQLGPGAMVEFERNGQEEHWDRVERDQKIESQRQYAKARRENLFLHRCSGETYEEIAKREGVSLERARQVVREFGPRLAKALRRTKFTITTE